MKSTIATKKIKILIFAKEWQLGGVATELGLLLPYLNKHYEVSLLAYAKLGEISVTEFTQTCFLFNNVPSWPRLILNLNRIKNTFLNLNPDMIITIDHPPTLMLWIINHVFRKRLPYVVSQHLAIDYFFCFRHTSINLIRNYLIKLSYREALAIQSVSTHLKKYLISLGIAREKIKVIPSSYSPKQISRTIKKRLKTKIQLSLNLLYLGRFSPEKNLDIVLKVFSLIPHPFAKKLTLIGDGPLRAILEKSRRQSRLLRNRLVITKLVQTPYRSLAAADILLLFSRAEASPHVLIEAMAVGTPFLTTLPHLRRELHCHPGCIVDSKDPEKISQRIQALARQPKLRRQISSLNLQRVKNFQIDVNARKHLQLLRSLLTQIKP